jgi:hypothetical protein
MSSVLPVGLTVPHRRRWSCYDPASARERYEASGVVSSAPETRRARGNTRRRCASSKHARLGCRYAPLPGCRAWGSGTMPSPATTRRSKLDFAARALHPTQVRRGFFPVSGNSTRAVIASLVYRVAAAWHPPRWGVRRLRRQKRPRRWRKPLRRWPPLRWLTPGRKRAGRAPRHRPRRQSECRSASR